MQHLTFTPHQRSRWCITIVRFCILSTASGLSFRSSLPSCTPQLLGYPGYALNPGLNLDTSMPPAHIVRHPEINLKISSPFRRVWSSLTFDLHDSGRHEGAIRTVPPLGPWRSRCLDSADEFLLPGWPQIGLIMPMLFTSNLKNTPSLSISLGAPKWWW